MNRTHHHELETGEGSDQPRGVLGEVYMHYVVRPSPIHGNGLFATRAIRTGETLIDHALCSEVLAVNQARAISEDERKFLSVIDGRYILFKPPARFVNHSCNPNARGQQGRDVAIRDIMAGEEITVDYVSEQVPDLNLACRCGADICRQWLRVSSL